MALYNISIGFKIFAVINLHQRNETFTVLNLHICNYYFLLHIDKVLWVPKVTDCKH